MNDVLPSNRAPMPLFSTKLYKPAVPARGTPLAYGVNGGSEAGAHRPHPGLHALVGDAVAQRIARASEEDRLAARSDRADRERAGGMTSVRGRTDAHSTGESR